MPALTVTATIAGMNDVAGGGYEPPDVVVAAGLGFVVEMVNVGERIWKTGAGAPELVQTVSLDSLFRAGGQRLTDPRVLYDAPSGRWFASISDLDSGRVLLAVSQTGDPSAAWSVYAFAASGCPDQPRLGVADGIVVLGADVFANCSESFSPVVGGELWILNKQEAVDGAPTVASTTYGPDRALTSLAPVQSLSPTPTEYVVSVDDPSSRVAHILTVDGIPPAAVRVQQVATVGIAPLTDPPSARQPFSTGATIATNDDRVLDSVWENGKLWFSANTGCALAGDPVRRSCGRVAEVSTGSNALDWSADIGVPGAYVFFPALRPDAAGNLDIVYGESSAALMPRVEAVARLVDGTFTAPVTVAQSSAAHVGSRYGDYFGAARDPADPSVVWVAGETTGESESGRGWDTVVAGLAVSPAGAEPPTVAASPPPAVRALAAKRIGSTVRLAYVALGDGTGVRVQLTVASGTSLVYRKTTPAAVVRANRTYSVVWHPGAQVHGAFRFCARTLDASGAVSLKSCAALTIRR